MHNYSVAKRNKLAAPPQLVAQHLSRFAARNLFAAQHLDQFAAHLQLQLAALQPLAAALLLFVLHHAHLRVRHQLAVRQLAPNLVVLNEVVAKSAKAFWRDAELLKRSSNTAAIDSNSELFIG